MISSEDTNHSFRLCEDFRCPLPILLSNYDTVVSQEAGILLNMREARNPEEGEAYRQVAFQQKETVREAKRQIEDFLSIEKPVFCNTCPSVLKVLFSE